MPGGKLCDPAPAGKTRRVCWTGQTQLAKRRRPAGYPVGSGRIAQLVEQMTLNHRVVGSIPTAPTKSIKHLASVTLA